MSIWNKILIGLVILVSLGFLYVAARTLKTHWYWRELAARLEEQIDKTRKETREIVEGGENGKRGDGSPSNKLAEAELRRVLINRGRVWLQCEPKADATTATTGQVAVSPSAGTTGISDKTIMYVFEEGDKDAPEGQKDKGRYLGEFLVTQVADKGIVLQPTMKLSPRELKRLSESSSSKGTWTLCEMMPVDRHDILADMPEEERKAWLPEATVNEYAHDGKEAEANDPDECKVKQADGSTKFVRRLRDYRQLFRAYHTEQTFYTDTLESLDRDIAYLQDSLGGARQHFQFAEREVAALTAELGLATKEKQSVINHQDAVARSLKGFQARVANAIQQNLAIARQIADYQLKAAQLIDERTRAMQPVARTGTGAN